jgi:hypothetical protein
MTRIERREKIDSAILKIVVPFLRMKGFKGSFPHFRRIMDDRINLLTFQHSQYSEKFVVEIANCPLNGIKTSWGKEIKPSKCTAHDMDRRSRLGSEKYNSDYWFDYGKTSLFSDIFKKRAHEIILLWDEAEKWWGSDPFGQRNENTDGLTN